MRISVKAQRLAHFEFTAAKSMSRHEHLACLAEQDDGTVLLFSVAENSDDERCLQQIGFHARSNQS